MWPTERDIVAISGQGTDMAGYQTHLLIAIGYLWVCGQYEWTTRFYLLFGPRKPALWTVNGTYDTFWVHPAKVKHLRYEESTGFLQELLTHHRTVLSLKKTNRSKLQDIIVVRYYMKSNLVKISSIMSVPACSVLLFLLYSDFSNYIVLQRHSNIWNGYICCLN